MVTVVSNGSKQVLSLKIDPEVVSKDDVEMLQDLILAALNDAHRKVDDAMQKNVGGMLGGKRDSRRAMELLAMGSDKPKPNSQLPTPTPKLQPPRARIPNRAASRTARAPDRTASTPARHRRQRRPTPGVSRAAHAARGRRPALRRDPRREGACDVLLGVQHHHRRRPLRVLHGRHARPPHSFAWSRSRRTCRRSRGRASSAGRITC